MRLIHLLSIVLSFAFTAFASIAAPGRHLSSSPKPLTSQNAGRAPILNFLISDVHTNSVLNLANSSLGNSFNTTIHIRFKDPNSKTETTCIDSWVDANVTATAPYSYVSCKPTNVTEFFQWKIVSYSGPEKFQLMFAHLFADPVNYPPPFDVVEYFSAPTNFTLVCSNATGLGSCSLPKKLSPVHAAINGIAN